MNHSNIIVLVPHDTQQHENMCLCLATTAKQTDILIPHPDRECSVWKRLQTSPPDEHLPSPLVDDLMTHCLTN